MIGTIRKPDPSLSFKDFKRMFMESPSFMVDTSAEVYDYLLKELGEDIGKQTFIEMCKEPIDVDSFYEIYLDVLKIKFELYIKFELSQSIQ